MFPESVKDIFEGFIKKNGKVVLTKGYSDKKKVWEFGLGLMRLNEPESSIV